MSRLDFDREGYLPDRETRRALPVLALWTVFIVALIGGSLSLAYEIYLEAVVGVGATSRTSGANSSAARKRRDIVDQPSKPVQNGSATPSGETATAEKQAGRSYEVFSASKLPAISPSTDVASGDSAGRMQAARRRAVAFSLSNDSVRIPVGPLAMRLESMDAKSQRYSANICIAEKCILLNDRNVNEVAVFTVPENAATFELVVTEISGNQVSGHVMVPAEN